MFFIFLFSILIFGTTISSYAESDWKIYHLNTLVNKNGKDVYEVVKIPYKITNGTLQSIKADQVSSTVIVNVNNVTNHGILEITIPRDVADASLLNGGDSKFFILIDNSQVNYQESDTLSCFRTLSIKIDSNTNEIQILGGSGGLRQSYSYVSPVYIKTSKIIQPNLVLISGCTDLILDGKELTLNITNSQMHNHKTISVVPDINGSFSVLVPIEDLGGNGNYTVQATYAGQNTTGTIIIPEFPSDIAIIFTLAISLVITKVILSRFNRYKLFIN